MTGSRKLAYLCGTLSVIALALFAAGCGGPEKGALQKSQTLQTKQESETTSSQATASTTGGSQTVTTSTTGPSGTTSTTTTQPATSSSIPKNADVAKGKQLFASTCAGCHTLADAGAAGTVGPDLDSLKPDYNTVKSQIANAAPPMPKNLYQGQDAVDVAAYVATAAGKGGS